MTSEPVVALAPVQFAAPAAVQAVALVANQVSVAELPETSMVGLAPNVTVGVAGGAPEPPEPPEEPELELDPDPDPEEPDDEELDDDELDPDELDPDELDALPDELELDEPEELLLEELEPDELLVGFIKPVGLELAVSTLEPPPEHALRPRLNSAALSASVIPDTERFWVAHRRLAIQRCAQFGSIIKLSLRFEWLAGVFPYGKRSVDGGFLLRRNNASKWTRHSNPSVDMSNGLGRSGPRQIIADLKVLAMV